MVYKLTGSMHIVAHCVFSDLCSGIDQVLFNYQMVFIIQWNVLCCCGVGCLAMHMKVMTLGRWVGLRRGIGEVSG